MNVQALHRPIAAVEADVLAIGLLDGDGRPGSADLGERLASLLGRLIDAKDLGRGVGDVTPLLGVGGGDLGLATPSVVVFGLGKPEKFDAGAAYAAGVALGKRMSSRARGRVAAALPGGHDRPEAVSAFVAGMIAGTVAADLRKSEPGRHPFEHLAIVGPEGGDLAAAVDRGAALGQAVNLARELANLPPAEKRPTAYAERARAEAVAAGLDVEVWDEAKIRDERFGGLLGVAAGSDDPPAFVVLEHRRGGDAPTLALVGKGVTFDSGGLSLKPSASMEDMKCDMTGSAVVLAAMTAMARLGVAANVVGYMAITENMVNGRAMRLGDVLTMRNGKTVEILNTDAEGRLILADALAYAVERGPAAIVDLATLTGACLVALGPKIAGLLGNDEAFAGRVAVAARAAGERTWPLPLDDDFLELLKSNVADLKNIGGKYAGATTAAKFLEQFVGETPWAHLDIAGPAWSDSDGATRDAGGTGCFVRTLVGLAEGWASSGGKTI